MMSDTNTLPLMPLILEAGSGKPPIFYGSVYFGVAKKKGVKITYIKQRVDKVVMCGSISEILKSDIVKRRVVIRMHLGISDAKKKVHDYDLKKVKLYSIVIYKFLGYGYK